MMSRATHTNAAKLIDAKRINRPATTAHAIKVNGLATGQPVKDDKGDEERDAERNQPPQSTRLEDWFVHLSLLLSALNISHPPEPVNG